MSKKNQSQGKENFNQAMYDMFGIGRDPGAESDDADDAPDVSDIVDNSFSALVSEAAPAAQPARTNSFHESAHRGRSTYLAEGTSIEGTLRCDGDVEICGDFKGELISRGKVIIHASTTSNVSAAELALVDCTLTGDATVSGGITIDGGSSVSGNIAAANVVCSGVIRGNLRVTENITLTEKAQVYGDISTDTLAISRGAKISGKIEMGLNNSN